MDEIVWLNQINVWCQIICWLDISHQRWEWLLMQSFKLLLFNS